MLLDSGLRALSKVLRTYMGEATLPTDSTRSRTTRPQRASVQRGGTITKCALDCYIVASATR